MLSHKELIKDKKSINSHTSSTIFKDGGLSKNSFLLFEFFEVKNPEHHFLKYRMIMAGVKVFALVWLLTYFALTIWHTNVAFIEPMCIFLFGLNIATCCANKQLIKYINGASELKKKIGNPFDYGCFGEKYNDYKNFSTYIEKKTGIKSKDSIEVLKLLNVPDFWLSKEKATQAKDACFKWACVALLGLVIINCDASTVTLGFSFEATWLKMQCAVMILMLFLIKPSNMFAGLLDLGKFKRVLRVIINYWLNEKNSV